MSSRNSGGPAFPSEAKIRRALSNGQIVVDGPFPGMTLRDYFAAKAMTYIQSRYEDGEAEAIAREAYLIADAMLAERERAQ